MSTQFVLWLPVFIFKKMPRGLKFQADTHTLISLDSQGQGNILSGVTDPVSRHGFVAPKPDGPQRIPEVSHAENYRCDSSNTPE